MEMSLQLVIRAPQLPRYLHLNPASCRVRDGTPSQVPSSPASSSNRGYIVSRSTFQMQEPDSRQLPCRDHPHP